MQLGEMACDALMDILLMSSKEKQFPLFNYVFLKELPMIPFCQFFFIKSVKFIILLTITA